LRNRVNIVFLGLTIIIAAGLAFVVVKYGPMQRVKQRAVVAQKVLSRADKTVKIDEYNTIFYIDNECFIYRDRPNHYPELRGCN